MGNYGQLNIDDVPNSIGYETTCKHCGKEFLATKQQKHCSKKCLAEIKRKRNYAYRVEQKKDKKLSLDKHILNNIKSSMRELLTKLKGL